MIHLAHLALPALGRYGQPVVACGRGGASNSHAQRHTASTTFDASHGTDPSYRRHGLAMEATSRYTSPRSLAARDRLGKRQASHTHIEMLSSILHSDDNTVVAIAGHQSPSLILSPTVLPRAQWTFPALAPLHRDSPRNRRTQQPQPLVRRPQSLPR